MAFKLTDFYAQGLGTMLTDLGFFLSLTRLHRLFHFRALHGRW